jgi:hypothetical protein
MTVHITQLKHDADALRQHAARISTASVARARILVRFFVVMDERSVGRILKTPWRRINPEHHVSQIEA